MGNFLYLSFTLFFLVFLFVYIFFKTGKETKLRYGTPVCVFLERLWMVKREAC